MASYSQTIDQHRKQLTVNLRNEAGDVILKRQVSTQWPRVRAFFAELRERGWRAGRCRAFAAWSRQARKTRMIVNSPPGGGG
jgi:hypothetical protein